MLAIVQAVASTAVIALTLAWAVSLCRKRGKSESFLTEGTRRHVVRLSGLKGE